jgi:hypothetical protein
MAAILHYSTPLLPSINPGKIDKREPKSINKIPINILNGIASCNKINARIGANIGLKKKTNEVV